MNSNLNPSRDNLNDFYSQVDRLREDRNYKKKNTLDPELYLQNSFKLNTGKEVKKIVRFRGVPIDKDNPLPFVMVKTHSVRQNGRTSYTICPKYTEGIDHLIKSKDCPFCELQKTFQDKAFQATSDTTRKELFETANKYRVIDMFIMKGLERDNYIYTKDSPKPEKIEVGKIKYWRFSSPKKDGYLDVIRELDSNKAQEYYERDEDPISIFDIHKGFDLAITSKSVKNEQGVDTFSVSKALQLAKESQPLSDNQDEIEEWINFPKKWWDVYTIKEYGALKVMALGYTPMRDSISGEWTSREEYLAVKVTGKTPFYDVETEKWTVKNENQSTPTEEIKPSLEIQVDNVDLSELPF